MLCEYVFLLQGKAALADCKEVKIYINQSNLVITRVINTRFVQHKLILMLLCKPFTDPESMFDLTAIMQHSCLLTKCSYPEIRGHARIS